jgi:hypothetical protein
MHECVPGGQGLTVKADRLCKNGRKRILSFEELRSRFRGCHDSLQVTLHCRDLNRLVRLLGAEEDP